MKNVVICASTLHINVSKKFVWVQPAVVDRNSCIVNCVLYVKIVFIKGPLLWDNHQTKKCK